MVTRITAPVVQIDIVTATPGIGWEQQRTAQHNVFNVARFGKFGSAAPLTRIKSEGMDHL